MAQCEKYFEWISAYVDGELDPASEAELFDHLAACPACSSALTDQLLLSSKLQDIDADPPETLTADVMAQIQVAPQFTVYRGTRRSSIRRFAAVAAVFALAAVVSYQMFWVNPPGGTGGSDYLFAAAPEPAAARIADVPAEEAELGRAAAEPAAESYHWDAERDEAVDFQTAAEEGDALLLGAGEEESDTLRFDTMLFDRYMNGVHWSWDDLSAALRGAGYTYVFDEGTFTVADPYNHGSYLYGSLGMDSDFGDAPMVAVIGYRFRSGESVRQAEVWFTRGEVLFYYGGGSPAGDIARLRQFLLFGQ